MAKQYGTIQATMDSLKERLEDTAGQAVEEKFKEIAQYSVYTAVPDESIDTGAYVTSFSIGRAGFGGGRSRSSENKPRNQNPAQKKDEAYGQLLSDINNIDFGEMLSTGNTKFTIRNRAPHAYAVENGGVNWRKSGYHVFAKIRNQFG